ncbi:hypothetical protein SSBG_05064 [Streptomyces sp. SPB074]|nr:hypothetical protein SSBG_05064 [Streptomyces sp. SPB074]
MAAPREERADGQDEQDVRDANGTGPEPGPAGSGLPPGTTATSAAGAPSLAGAPSAPAARRDVPGPPPLPTRGPGTHGPLPSPRHQAATPPAAPYAQDMPGEPDREDPVPGFMERERFRADPDGARARFFGDDSGELFFDPLQGLGPLVSTENGLPVRPPGRTMAAVDQMIAELLAGETPAPAPQQDVGRSFGGFDRAMRAGRAAREAAAAERPAAPPGPAPRAQDTPSPAPPPGRETP